MGCCFSELFNHFWCIAYFKFVLQVYMYANVGSGHSVHSFFYQRYLGYLSPSPSLVKRVFLGQQTDQTAPLPPSLYQLPLSHISICLCPSPPSSFISSSFYFYVPLSAFSVLPLSASLPPYSLNLNSFSLRQK